jgi:hypothetical protein
MDKRLTRSFERGVDGIVKSPVIVFMLCNVYGKVLEIVGYRKKQVCYEVYRNAVQLIPKNKRCFEGSIGTHLGIVHFSKPSDD